MNLPTPTPLECRALTAYLRYLQARGVTSFTVNLDQARPDKNRDVRLRLTGDQTLIDCTQAEPLQIEEGDPC